MDVFPITTLPHELLGEIFTHCTASCPDAPAVLGRVSRLFRHIAHTTPAAWSRLRLNDTDGARKAALWLDRARACRIAVHVHMAAPGSADAAVAAPAVLDTLRTHAHHIDSLCLRTETQAQARDALAAIYAAPQPPPRAVALCSLRIVAAAEPARSSGPLVVFPALPGLRELEVTNVALGALPSLDLARLEELRVLQPLRSQPLAAQDMLALVHSTPRLRRLKVEARMEDPSTTTTANEMALLPRLTHLHLRANNVLSVCDQLTVPALQTLHLHDLDGRRPGASGETGAALKRLLIRMELGEGDVKSNEMKVLELRGVAVDRSEAIWQRCIERMRVLERFSVDLVGEREEAEEDISAPLYRQKTPRAIQGGFCFGFGAPLKAGRRLEFL